MMFTKFTPDAYGHVTGFSNQTIDPESRTTLSTNGYQKFSNGLIIQWACFNFRVLEHITFLYIAFP
jgi:hypothetical protein